MAAGLLADVRVQTGWLEAHWNGPELSGESASDRRRQDGRPQALFPGRHSCRKPAGPVRRRQFCATLRGRPGNSAGRSRTSGGVGFSVSEKHITRPFGEPPKVSFLDCIQIPSRRDLAHHVGRSAASQSHKRRKIERMQMRISLQVVAANMVVIRTDHANNWRQADTCDCVRQLCTS